MACGICQGQDGRHDGAAHDARGADMAGIVLPGRTRCRTGCREGGHQTWGECARAAAIQIDRHALAGHKPAEVDKDKRLTRYESARNSGLQPKSTSWQHVRAAEESGGVRPTPISPPAA